MLVETVAVFGLLCVFMVLGIPIAVSLGLTGICTLVFFGNIEAMVMFPAKLFVGADSFPLLAIPFFILAGDLMLQGGISKRLVTMAKCFLYGLRGSLALISFVAAAFFGALSGSAMATTAAIGKIMYPEMLNDGSYDKGFALSVQAVGGTLGPMIPPSITLIIFGTTANASIGDMMIATLIPGVIICLIYCITGYVIIRRRGMATNSVKSEKGVLASLADGVWALITPIIILGGVYGGIFSPTESAAVACLYAVLVGRLVYRELTLKKLYSALESTFSTFTALMLLMCSASFFGWVLTMEGIPQYITQLLMASIGSKYVLLLLINCVFLFLGCFMDVITIVLLVIPLVAPAAMALGVNMVHLGVITNIVTGVGIITPPFGVSLFVASGIDRSVKLENIYKNVLPFCVAAVVGGFVITYVPQLSLWFK